MVGEQHRCTIGREDSQQQIGGVGDQPVCARPPVLRPWGVGDHDLGRMDLMDRCELGLGQDCGNGQAPVARDRFAVVPAAVADVQPRAFADRHPAATAKEAVREPVEADGADDLDGQRTFLMMMSSSAWLPTMKS